MEKEEIFMKGYLNKSIKITFLDNLHVIGMYVNYYYFNNVIVIEPVEDDIPILIPISAIKTIARWPIEEYDVLEDD
ncbi:MAG: hypothetical protein K6T94_08305 [Paenibacillus sp.]|nr:hypothetical protein [Paenibacillus sp.]